MLVFLFFVWLKSFFFFFVVVVARGFSEREKREREASTVLSARLG